MRTHVRLARCCFCFCPCAVMPLLCTKKIPISNRSSHSSRDARACSRSLTQFCSLTALNSAQRLLQLLLLLLSQWRLFLYWFILLEFFLLLRASESSVELREREQWVVTWVQTELWVLLVWSLQSGRSASVCVRVRVSLRVCVCVCNGFKSLTRQYTKG